MNLIAEGHNYCESRQVIYYWKKECLSFIQKQTYENNMQIMLMNIKLMTKTEYLIVPKGTNFTGSRKLKLMVPKNDKFLQKRNINFLHCIFKHT